MTALTSDASWRLYFWPTSFQLKAPMTPFSGLQGWLTELRKALYFLLLVYHKGSNSGITKWKRGIGQGIKWRFGGCTQLPCLLRTHHPPSASMCSPTWRLSEPWLLVFFHAGFIMQALLITSLTTSEWTQLLAPLPFPEVGLRMGLTLVAWLFLWQQPQPSSCLGSYKNHLISINSGMVERSLLFITKDAPITPITQEILRVLEALCQEPEQTPNVDFLSHLSQFGIQESGKWRQGRFQCWFGF